MMLLNKFDGDSFYKLIAFWTLPIFFYIAVHTLDSVVFHFNVKGGTIILIHSFDCAFVPCHG